MSKNKSFSSLGEAIRVLRERRGLTLRALAERVGVTAPFLSDIEHNRRSTDKLNVLAKQLGVSVKILKRLDGRVKPNLKKWLAANPGLVEVLEELQSSGKPVPLEELRDTLRGHR